MARVLIPTHSRVYNHNPKGSSTAVVTMKGANPFERDNSREAMRPMLRASRPGGLAGLGDDPPVLGPPSPTPTAPAASSGAIDWSGIAQAAATAAQPIIAAQAARLIPRSGSTPMTGPTPTALPIGYQPVAPHKSKLPWILGGVGLVAVVGVAFLMLRKH